MTNTAFSFLPSWRFVPDALFWTGLALFTAGICGELCWKIWRLPRITGYSAIGLIAGSAGLGVIDQALVGQARFLIDIALALLLFELGSRLSFRWIRTNPWLIATSLTESTLTFAAVTFVLHLMGFEWITAMVAGSIAISTSPTMVIQLRSEVKSEGQVTERLMVLTTLNSMYAVLLLKFVSAWLHQQHYKNIFASLTELAYWLIGSLALAYALAHSCRFLYRRFNMQAQSSFVMLIGLVLLTLSIAHTLKLSTTFTLLAAGIIFKNIDERPQLWPTHFGTAGWLLTVILFVITLIPFEWQFISMGGLAALAIIGVRFLAKFASVLAFAKPSGLSLKQGAALGLALSPMSVLAYVLVSDIYSLYPDITPALHAVMQCSIVVLQIVAPLLVYWGLSFCGERRQ